MGSAHTWGSHAKLFLCSPQTSNLFDISMSCCGCALFPNHKYQYQSQVKTSWLGYALPVRYTDFHRNDASLWCTSRRCVTEERSIHHLCLTALTRTETVVSNRPAWIPMPLLNWREWSSMNHWGTDTTYPWLIPERIEQGGLDSDSHARIQCWSGSMCLLQQCQD